MPIGYDIIAESAIGEDGSSTDTFALIPTVTVALSTSAPVIHVGVAIKTPAAEIILTAQVPKINTGVQLQLPAAGVFISGNNPGISISSTIHPPVASITFTTSIPSIAAGRQVTSPAAVVTLTAPTPSIRAGKRIDVPTASIVLTSSSAKVSVSARLSSGFASITLTTNAPNITSGKFIDASNTITQIDNGGEIAGNAISMGAIGEGELSSTIVRRPPNIIVQAIAPSIRAGVNMKPPAASIVLTSQVAEIAARRRKLRVLAIAS